MKECWKKKNSNTHHNRQYYVNLESGISQWGIPANELLLPAGWEMHLSKSKKDPFYTNSEKNISQWNIPTKEDGNKVPEGWEEMRSSKCKSIYYKNNKTGISKWIIGVKPVDLNIPTIFVKSTKSDLDIKAVGIPIPKSFLPIIENCSHNNIWKKNILLGSGDFGEVYIACKGTDCEYVIKIQKENKEYYTEIDALLSLQHTKAVPSVFAAWTCEKFGYFVMEKLYNCSANSTIMWKEVAKKLDIVKQAGYLHIDIHAGNVMCNKYGEVLLIDFGYAVKRTEEGDSQTYPDNKISKNYGIPLTWKYLEIIQENNHNKYFNPAVISLDRKSITEEQILADKNCAKKYVDAKIKVIQQKEEEKIRKEKYDAKIKVQQKEEEKIRKEKIQSRLQVHLNYQNGLEENYKSWEYAKGEISSGEKKEHWIWYVFPSFLPVRKTSRKPFLILKDLDEVKAYIANDVLRKRLVVITDIAQKKLNDGINDAKLFGSKDDALKFWECITLFFLASMSNDENSELQKLNEVCDKALRALHPLHPLAKDQDRLHQGTVNAFIELGGKIPEKGPFESVNISTEYFMIVTTKNGHSERLKKLYIKNYSYDKEFTPKYRYDAIMNSNDIWFHLVNNNDMIIGCCSAKIERNSRYIIDDVFVEEKFRGNNYSKLLLLYAMKSVRANNINASFQITAHDYNTPAVRTYSKIFGKPIRVKNNMFVYSGIPEHELEMQLKKVPLVNLV